MYFHNSSLRDYKNTVKVKILQDFVQMLRHMCVLLHKVHCLLALCAENWTQENKKKGAPPMFAAHPFNVKNQI